MKRSIIFLVAAFLLTVIVSCDNLGGIYPEETIKFENYVITIGNNGTGETPLEIQSEGSFDWEAILDSGECFADACGKSDRFLYAGEGGDAVGVKLDWMRAEYLTSDRKGMKLYVLPNDSSVQRSCTISFEAIGGIPGPDMVIKQKGCSKRVK